MPPRDGHVLLLAIYIVAGMIAIGICAPIAYAAGMKSSLIMIWDEVIVSSWLEIKKYGEVKPPLFFFL